MAVIFFSQMQHAFTLRIPLLCGLNVKPDDVGSVLQHCSSQPGPVVPTGRTTQA
jgi:hypothetical protein